MDFRHSERMGKYCFLWYFFFRFLRKKGGSVILALILAPLGGYPSELMRSVYLTSPAWISDRHCRQQRVLFWRRPSERQLIHGAPFHRRRICFH